MKRRYTLMVTGNNHTWSFDIEAHPRHVAEWQHDGLDVCELVNTIPVWWVEAGLPVRAWCFLQDVFNFKNPFGRW